MLSPGTEGGKEDPGVLSGSAQQEDEDLAALTGQQPGTVIKADAFGKYTEELEEV